MEIKYRAWDKQENVMRDVTMLLFNTQELDYFGNLNEPKSWDHFEIMQFTGLYDIEGKEIYEGDLIEYENGNAGYGRPRYQEINIDAIPPLTDHDAYVDNWVWWKYGKIIGNVYTNFLKK
jgi:hypothetical protein